MPMSDSDPFFLDVSAHFSLRVATKGSIRQKNQKIYHFLGYFSKSKTE